MNKKILIFLLLILATVFAFAWFSLKDPGFIVIGRGAWTVETSLSAFILALVLGGLVIYILVRLLFGLWNLPLLLWHKSTAQLQKKAHESLVRGSLALIQGHWQTAEQVLLKTVSQGELSALHYFGAAYAAYQQQAPSRAADYFSQMRKTLPKEAVALSLFEAKLQQQQSDLLAALKNAQSAHALAPKHHEVLLLLLTLHIQLANWQALLELLPELRKILSTEQLQQLENRTNIALILQTLRSNPEQTQKIWARIPKINRLRPAVVKVYVEYLMKFGDTTTAEQLLREALKYQWDAGLVSLYGALETVNTTQQINYAENWLKSHEKDEVLLRTLGQLCLRNHLWGKAQQYLEDSMKLVVCPETYQLLGELSKQKQELSQATEHYCRGLQLAISTRIK